MTPIFQLRGINKSFSKVKVINNINIDFFSGEVHALIGENGAGKSTLCKIITGVYRANGGEMKLGDKLYSCSHPKDAINSGIFMIYQEPNLAPDLNVYENIMLGYEKKGFGFIDSYESKETSIRILDQLGFNDIDIYRSVKNMSISEQKIVEIAHALVLEPKIIILDEPTSALSKIEIDKLFSMLLKLKEKGIAILFITHFLEEVETIADRYSILKDGKLVESQLIEKFDAEKIINKMSGRTIRFRINKGKKKFSNEVLRFEGVNGAGIIQNVSFKLRKGEIFGIAGLIGSGKSEILNICFGLKEYNKGSISFKGQKISNLNPSKMIKIGIGYLPENRTRDGLMLDLNVTDNILIGNYNDIVNKLIISKRAEVNHINEIINNLNVKVNSIEQQVSELSGGNQQKIIMARLMNFDLDIFLLDEPTRGVDVKTRKIIYEYIKNLSDKGKSIIIASAYIPELLTICDTISVLYNGKMLETLPVNKWDEEKILSHSMGLQN